MKNKYNLKVIQDKLNRRRNVKLEDVSLENVDEITDIKINLVMKEYWVLLRQQRILIYLR